VAENFFLDIIPLIEHIKYQAEVTIPAKTLGVKSSDLRRNPPKAGVIKKLAEGLPFRISSDNNNHSPCSCRSLAPIA